MLINLWETEEGRHAMADSRGDRLGPLDVSVTSRRLRLAGPMNVEANKALVRRFMTRSGAR